MQEKSRKQDEQLVLMQATYNDTGSEVVRDGQFDIMNCASSHPPGQAAEEFQIASPRPSVSISEESNEHKEFVTDTTSETDSSYETDTADEIDWNEQADILKENIRLEEEETAKRDTESKARIKEMKARHGRKPSLTKDRSNPGPQPSGGSREGPSRGSREGPKGGIREGSRSPESTMPPRDVTDIKKRRPEKIKEHDTIPFPPYPKPNEVRSWRTQCYTRVSNASGRPNEALYWIGRVRWFTSIEDCKVDKEW